MRSATAKFRDRFMAVEQLAKERGLELGASDLAALDALWDEVKAAQQKAAAAGRRRGEPAERRT